jgi:hypothetical protein
MGLVFEVQPGYALQLPYASGGDPFTVDVAGFGDAQASRSIITQLSVRRGANAQFVHSLQDLIYVYSFGERIGTITAAGLSFVGMCDGGVGKTGIEYVLDYYEANRLGGDNGGPLRLLIGGAGGSGTFRGYLTGLAVDVAKPDLRLANFALQFQTLPQRRRRA